MRSILVVDRDPEVHRQMAEVLRPYLVGAIGVQQADEARLAIERRRFEVTVLDHGVAPIDCYCRWSDQAPPMIASVDEENCSVLRQALQARAIDVLVRPVDVRGVVTRVLEVLEDRISSPHFLSRRLDDYLRRNCQSRDLSLVLLSERFGISASYASMLLRMGPWRGFKSRLAHHRVRRAEVLISRSNEPLYIVAEKCGFASPARLSETFRRLTGMTPKRYRERHRASG